MSKIWGVFLLILVLSPANALAATAMHSRSSGSSCPVPTAPAGAGSPTATGKYGVQIDVPSCGRRSGAIDRAFERAIDHGTRCLAGNNLLLMIRLWVQVAKNNTQISCLDPVQFHLKEGQLSEGNREEDGASHANQHGGNHLCALGDVKGNGIYLSPLAFDPVVCGPLEGVLFHELLHNIGVKTTPSHDPGDLPDGVYGCELTCFGPKPVDPLREQACKQAN